MKKILLVFLIGLLALSAFSQQKQTDLQFEGLKGKVKSVKTDYVITLESNERVKKPKRNNDDEYTFEPDGRLAQIAYVYYTIDRKTEYKDTLVFSIIDGFKTFKTIRDKRLTKSGGSGFRAAPLEEPEPIEKPEKLVPEDSRFDQKYVYEYDSQGRVKIEREYANNGRLFHKREFKYDDKGYLIEKNVNDTVALSKFTYKYDLKGNLIEELEDRDIKGAGIDSKSRTTFSDYKLDKQGNWIERKSTEYYEDRGTKLKTITIYYRTIIYY